MRLLKNSFTNNNSASNNFESDDKTNKNTQKKTEVMQNLDLSNHPVRHVGKRATPQTDTILQPTHACLEQKTGKTEPRLKMRATPETTQTRVARLQPNV